MSWLRKFWGRRLRRERPAEREARLSEASEQLFSVVDATGTAASDDAGLIGIAPTSPIKPAPVKLPAGETAAVREIRARWRATREAIQQRLAARRAALRKRREQAQATVALRGCQLAQAQGMLAQVGRDRSMLVEQVPVEQRRLLGRRRSRLFPLVPWVLWLADTLLIARAWGLLGPIALPFEASGAFTNGSQLARAALVSFGLVFGCRLAGSRVRETLEELRPRFPLVVAAAPLVVAGVLLLLAVRVAAATAQMQAVLVGIEAGGSDAQLPTSVLASITLLMVGVSAACGYLLHDPHNDHYRDLQRRHDQATKLVGSAEQAVAQAEARVRVIDADIDGLNQQEQHALRECDAHCVEEVANHMRSNVPIYGLEPAVEARGATP